MTDEQMAAIFNEWERPIMEGPAQPQTPKSPGQGPGSLAFEGPSLKKMTFTLEQVPEGTWQLECSQCGITIDAYIDHMCIAAAVAMMKAHTEVCPQFREDPSSFSSADETHELPLAGDDSYGALCVRTVRRIEKELAQ